MNVLFCLTLTFKIYIKSVRDQLLSVSFIFFLHDCWACCDFKNFKISSSTCIIFHKTFETQFSITFNLLIIPKWKIPFVSFLGPLSCRIIMLVHPKHIPGYCYVAMCSKKNGVLNTECLDFYRINWMKVIWTPTVYYSVSVSKNSQHSVKRYEIRKVWKYKRSYQIEKSKVKNSRKS